MVLPTHKCPVCSRYTTSEGILCAACAYRELNDREEGYIGDEHPYDIGLDGIADQDLL
jgi:hypothetical protein